MPKGKTSKNKQTSSDPYPTTKKNIDKTDTNVEDATVETDTVHYTAINQQGWNKVPNVVYAVDK